MPEEASRLAGTPPGLPTGLSGIFSMLVATTTLKMRGFAMSRTALCYCGSLRVQATDEPAFAGAFHCTEYQRRTGSPFGLGIYFPKEQVRTEGRTRSSCAAATRGARLNSTLAWQQRG